MSRKNNKFSIFEDVGDNIIERLSNSYNAMSKEERKRVFAMSERKLNDMKKSKNVTNDVNNPIKNRSVKNDVGKVEIVDRPKSYRIVMTATAAAAAFAVIVGVAFAAKNVGDIDVDSDISSVSSNKDLYAQVRTTPDDADSENSNTVTSRESSADSEKISGEENSKKEEKSSRETSSSSKVTSSKSESVHAESTGSSAVQSAAAVSSQSVGVNEQQPDTTAAESISIAAEETDSEIRPSENAAGVYSSKSGIITLYADGTGTISFQDTVSIKWNDQVLIGEDFTYPYTISGDTITIDRDGMELSFTKGGEMPQIDDFDSSEEDKALSIVLENTDYTKDELLGIAENEDDGDMFYNIAFFRNGTYVFYVRQKDYRFYTYDDFNKAYNEYYDGYIGHD